MEFNQRMKSRRLELRLTQHDVAQALGVATSSYALYESGRRQPDVKKIKLISKILKIDAGTLLGTSIPGETIEKVNHTEELMLKLFRSLSPESKSKILSHAQDLATLDSIMK